MSYSALLNNEITDLQYLEWLHEKSLISAVGLRAILEVSKDLASIFCHPINADMFIESIEGLTHNLNRIERETKLIEQEITKETNNPKSIDMGQRLLILFYGDGPNIYTPPEKKVIE